MSAKESKRIVPVDLCNDGRDLMQGGRCLGIEDTLADARHVGGDSVYAMGVDAAEVG